MKNFLQSYLLFLLAVYGNIPYQNEKSLNAKTDAVKEFLNYLYLKDFTWNKRNEEICPFSIFLLKSHQEVIFESKIPIKTHIFSKLSDTKTLYNEFKITCNTEEMKALLPKNFVLNNLRGNHILSRMISSEITHSGLVKEEISHPEQKHNVWDNTFQNYFKDFKKNNLRNYTQSNREESSIYNMKPTKSSLFQYFRPSQPPVLNYFHLNHNLPYVDDYLEEDISENYTLHSDKLFDAVKINSNSETLIDTPTLDQRVATSSNAVILEGSFTNLKSMTSNIGDSNFHQFSSPCNNKKQASSGVTPIVSINDCSAYSDSESESFSETDVTDTDNQVFTSGFFVHSSSSPINATLTSIRQSQPIYATSVLEYSISRIYSSSYFDDIF